MNRDSSEIETNKTAVSEFHPGDAGWRAFLELTRYHKVLPAVCRNLPILMPGRVPEDIGVKLERRFERHKQRSALISTRLIRLTRRFDSCGVFAICLKGPVLAHQLYGDISARHTGDLDFLLCPGEMQQVHGLLVQEGFRLWDPRLSGLFDSPARFNAYAGSNKHVSYIQRDDRTVVECHYRLFNNPHLFPVDWRELKEDAQEVWLSGENLNVLSPLHLVLYLIAHGAQHKWFRLKWLLDILYFCCDPLPGLEWKQVFINSSKLGLERMLAQGLELARKLLNAQLPEYTGKLGANLPQVTGLVRIAENEIEGRLSRKQDKNPLKGFIKRIYLFKLRRGIRHKLYTMRVFFYVDANRDIMKLPDRLFFLYYLLGPVLWVFRRFIKKKTT